MFHETFLPLNKRSIKRLFAGTLQRLMAVTLIGTSQAAFASNESGARALRKLCLGAHNVLTLPVFSNIEPSSIETEAGDKNRTAVQQANPKVLIGHFGRYMASVEPLVLPVFASLLQRNPKVEVLFIGECGERYRAALIHEHPEWAARVHDSGICSSEQIAASIASCSFMLQLYPGGLTTKRSSTMAALANGRLVVSNFGSETEPFWQTCSAVHLVDNNAPSEVARQMDELIAAPERIARGCSSATDFYTQHFSSQRTIDTTAAHLRNTTVISAPELEYARTEA